MSKKQQFDTCVNCKHWNRHHVNYGEYPEDECGSCSMNDGETTYADEEACEDFEKTDRVWTYS